MNISYTQWADLIDLIEAGGGGYINVKSFGATGDGVTDDTVAIQAAVDAGPMGIFFPAGRYVVTSPIEITVDRKLFGDAEGIGTIRGTQIYNATDPADYAFSVTAFSYMGTRTTFRDMTIMDWSQPTPRTRGGIELVSNHHAHIENVSFRWLDTCISLDFALTVTVQKCSLYESTNGITTTSSCNVLKVLDCYVNGITGTGINLISSAYGCLIDGTVFEGAPCNIGIDIHSNDNSVEHCYFEGVPHDIELSGSNNSISGNLFGGPNAVQHIKVSGDHNNIFHNVFYDASVCSIYWDTGAEYNKSFENINSNLLEDINHVRIPFYAGPANNRIGRITNDQAHVDFELRNPGSGFVVCTPDGTKFYRIAVANNGTLTTTDVT